MVRYRLAERFIMNNQKFRDILFKPILTVLTYFNITGNYLSNLKLILSLPFIYFAFINLKIAFVFILASIFVDLFDGPLARMQKINSDRGKFVDIFGDFIIYLSVIFTLYYLNLFNNNLLVYNLFIFPMIAILSTIRKQEFTKTDWIIKPAPEIGHFNALFYLLLFLFIYFNINYIDLVLFFINLIYTFLTIYYFIFIQFRWLKN